MKSLLILSGFFLLSIVPKHEHVEARRYYNHMEFIRATVCVEDDTLLFKDGKHMVITKHGLIIERPEI